MMDGLPLVFAIVGALFGRVATTLMGMAVSRLGGIETHLEKLNGKLFDHVTEAETHEAGFARMQGEINSLLQVAKTAHLRVDKLEERMQ